MIYPMIYDMIYSKYIVTVVLFLYFMIALLNVSLKQVALKMRIVSESLNSYQSR